MRSIYHFLTVLSLCLMSYSANAETYSSGNQQVNLIELYTSEGCNGCPPADEWLSSLEQKAGLWSEFIPLAFHVDYWDYIGWTDRFADNRFNQRQYSYVDTKNLSSVYTPGMLLNGQEWRKRPWDKFPNQNQDNAGTLCIDVNNNQLNANYQSSMTKNQSLVLNIALLGFDLESNIDSGENHGKTLNHNFVVLGYKTVAMQPTRTDFESKQINLPQTLQTSERIAIATWVSTLQNLSPLQATGGWLTNDF